MRPKGLIYTGEVSKQRKEGKKRREEQKSAIKEGRVQEEAGERLPPKEFEQIQSLYWSSLKAVPDPRNPLLVIYPLWLILHRIISGFLSGTTTVFHLFPTTHKGGTIKNQRLGALPTAQAVYNLLNRIDWEEANIALAPLWEHLGFQSSLLIRQHLREPKEILEEVKKKEEERKKKEKRK